MTKKITRLFSLALAVYCLFSTQVFALSDANIQRADESEAFISTAHTSDLNINTGKYLYGADVIAKNEATSTYVSIVIQRRANGEDYEDVPGTFRSSTSNSIYAYAGDVWYVYSGYWYRTKATYIVTLGGKEYKVVQYSDHFWYPKN